MKYMSGTELREKYLQFFVEKGHLRLASASLVPENDPTLLMVGAGMAPFKPFFTGKMQPPCTRITTSQRCVRTGDIENVGRTARHQTYFEMLGNFSFGDYFKHDAINWAWEFLTEVVELPKDKLWVTIYPKDDEAYKIWTEEAGVDPSHIVKLDDNFWEIGPGPCGPDSEIHIDLGEDRGCGKPDCAVGCDCDRFLEIWNLVFTQYDRTETGEYNPLAHKNIDTGCGLERLASVVQGKRTNFETDLLYPIIEYAAKVSGITYGNDETKDISLKVIADHARSMAVMIMDGILPSNEGRGYVLRRILRRAIRHGRMLGITGKFLMGAVDAVIKIYDGVPDFDALIKKQDYIKKVISIEEDRFHATLVQGMELLNGHIDDLKKANTTVLVGEVGFKLYDTFGFPWELTEEILHENSMTLDKDGFDIAMQQQRERARAARQANQRVAIPDLRELDTKQLTIDTLATEAAVVCIWKDGKMVEELQDGEEAGIIINVTPFYAEGGGQVGDEGTFVSELGKITISNAKKLPDGTIYHIGYVEEGMLRIGDMVKITINHAKKIASARNHTATHLLQAALKRVVGEQVNQAGSFVSADRLRFDFSNFEPVSDQQLCDVEELVNEQILMGKDVEISQMSQEKAKKLGAMALFGEKYGDIVRVVSVRDFSMELCGGSHVKNIGQIGMFKIVGETGIASGVRRIEAITGKAAIDYMNGKLQILSEAACKLKVHIDEVPLHIDKMLAAEKELQQAVAAVREEKTKADVQKLLMDVQLYGDVNVIVGKANAADIDQLRTIADMACNKVECGVAVLAAVHDGKVNLVVKASKEAVSKGIHAGKIIKEVAKIVGGGGGGRPDMAQAGGKQPEKLLQAFEEAHEVIQLQIK
ncbi:MAG: alanine--tRNA ligase [Selenomonadaceae bacterium]